MSEVGMDFSERVLWKMLREPGYGFTSHQRGWGLAATEEPYVKFTFSSVDIDAEGCTCSAEATGEVVVEAHTAAYYDPEKARHDAKGRHWIVVNDDVGEFVRNFIETSNELHEEEMGALRAPIQEKAEAA